MAEDPEQLDLQDKEGQAQSKALDQLTDNVGEPTPVGCMCCQ